jgi:hypothetical protein
VGAKVLQMILWEALKLRQPFRVVTGTRFLHSLILNSVPIDWS